MLKFALGQKKKKTLNLPISVVCRQSQRFGARAESRFLKRINFTAIFDLEKAAAGSNDHDLDPERVLSAEVGLRESAARDIV